MGAARRGVDGAASGTLVCRGIQRSGDGGTASSGGVAEWLGRGLQSPVHRFDSGPRLETRYDVGPRALSSGGERFLDAEEVRGSNPLAPTKQSPGHLRRIGRPC